MVRAWLLVYLRQPCVGHQSSRLLASTLQYLYLLQLGLNLLQGHLVLLYLRLQFLLLRFESLQFELVW